MKCSTRRSQFCYPNNLGWRKSKVEVRVRQRERVCEVVYYARYLDLSVHMCLGMHAFVWVRTHVHILCLFYFPPQVPHICRTVFCLFQNSRSSPARISCSRVRCLWCLYFALRSCVYVCASSLVPAILRRVHRLDECMQYVHTCFCVLIV